ncbi:MAG: ribosome silencing factor [Lachnospiraceae bacterium]|jgi:ribosome-associated protein|nr:ribosome silencing factor [Lachnospiraceae bacterium]
MIQNKKMILHDLYKLLDEKKGENIKIIDIKGLSIMSDYFVIVSGNNLHHIDALVSHTEKFMKDNGIEMKQREGSGNADWILLDYGDIIIQIFTKDSRIFYDLDHIWADGKVLNQ